MEKNSAIKKREHLSITAQDQSESKQMKDDSIEQIDLLEIYVEKSRAIGLG